jgi:hypothetical protein
MPVVACSTNWSRRAGIRGNDRNFDAELLGNTGLALADAFGLEAALALPLGSNLGGSTLSSCSRTT